MSLPYPTRPRRKNLEHYTAPRNPGGKRTPSYPKLKLSPTMTKARRPTEKRFFGRDR